TQYARTLGISSALNQDLSISLGSSSVYLHEMVQAYATFANGGRKVRPIFIRRILDRDGNELINTTTLGSDPSTELLRQSGPADKPEAAGETMPKSLNEQDPDQILSPQTAFNMASLMKGVIPEG